MVLVFIFCQCFTIVADIYELTCTLFPPPTDRNSTFCKSNVHIENFIDIAHFMIAVNSSVNFIFYMVNIKEYRESLVKVRYYFSRDQIYQIILIQHPFSKINIYFVFQIACHCFSKSRESNIARQPNKSGSSDIIAMETARTDL